MRLRLVRYAELRPCTSAFIDAHTPGSARKENFTIIGPGVAENPEQHVHIRIPHGFNVGGARQPSGCTNSQHSHDTAEVFVMHTGGVRFKTGEHGTAGYVDLCAGDVISIPVCTFRGFDTLGDKESFMFSVLGGDDPGRVLWVPYVFETASACGLVLLSSGRLIDTLKGDVIPPGDKSMPTTSAADTARIKDYDTAAISAYVVRRCDFEPAIGDALSHLLGVEEFPLIGASNPAERMPAGRTWKHGFHLRTLRLAPSAVIPVHACKEPEVVLMHSGSLRLEWADGALDLGPGDTLTVRSYRCTGTQPAEAYVVRGRGCTGGSAVRLTPSWRMRCT